MCISALAESDADVAAAKRESKKEQIPTWEKKLSDYDYLVMMSLIKLSEEEVRVPLFK